MSTRRRLERKRKKALAKFYILCAKPLIRRIYSGNTVGEIIRNFESASLGFKKDMENLCKQTRKLK